MRRNNYINWDQIETFFNFNLLLIEKINQLQKMESSFLKKTKNN